MRKALRLFVSAAGLLYAENARAQASYRNLDAGFPVRVEDATVTERYALDLDFLNFRYDELSDLRTRFQYEPQVSYGIFPRKCPPLTKSKRGGMPCRILLPATSDCGFLPHREQPLAKLTQSPIGAPRSRDLAQSSTAHRSNTARRAEATSLRHRLYLELLCRDR